MELEPVTLDAWGFTGGSVIFVQTNPILEEIQISFAALFSYKRTKRIDFYLFILGQLREQLSYLKGDNFFRFTCSDCSEDGKEQFERLRLTWQQVSEMFVPAEQP